MSERLCRDCCLMQSSERTPPADFNDSGCLSLLYSAAQGPDLEVLRRVQRDKANNLMVAVYSKRQPSL